MLILLFLAYPLVLLFALVILVSLLAVSYRNERVEEKAEAAWVKPVWDVSEFADLTRKLR